MTITPDQCLAARMLAEIDAGPVSIHSGIALERLRGFEQGRCTLDAGEAQRLSASLENFGIEWVPESEGTGAGMRLKFDRRETIALSDWETEGGETADDKLP